MSRLRPCCSTVLIRRSRTPLAGEARGRSPDTDGRAPRQPPRRSRSNVAHRSPGHIHRVLSARVREPVSQCTITSWEAGRRRPASHEDIGSRPGSWCVLAVDGRLTMGIEQIDHFVVLMLENRSFDHTFGLRPGVNGILDAHHHSKFSNGGIAASGGAPFAIPTKHGLGPFHNVTDVNEQLFGTKNPAAGAHPTMDGFVANYREALQHDTRGSFTQADLAVVMRSFDNGALPAITALADNFVLCDAWFCEVPGSTHPNRLYMHAGTSQGF